MSNWTGRPKVRRRGGMAQSVGRTVPNVQLDWYAYGAQAWWHGSVGRTNWSKCPTELVGREYETWWHGSVGRTTETSYPTGKFPAGAENKVAWLSR